MRTPFTSIALLLIDSPAHVRNHADESDSTRLARVGMVREMDVLGRSAVKTEVYSSSGVAPLSNFDSKLKFRGLLVDESQLPAAVFSGTAFTVRSLAFTH